MERLSQDVRVALRGFRRSPTFAVTAVLILGVGIGMAVAMWGVFNAVLVRPLPVVSQEDLVVPRTLDAAGVDLPFTVNEIDNLRLDSRTMRDVAGFSHYGTYTFPLVDGDQPIVLHQAPVTGEFFRVLGARPFLGRMLQPTDDSTSHVMVLSYRAWRRQFGGDPAVIGHHIRDTHVTWFYTIVGVAPPGLDFPIGADCWIPILSNRANLDLIARVAPHTSLAAARGDFFTLAKALDARRAGGSIHVLGVGVKSLRTEIVGGSTGVLVVLLAAVILLLVIACVNVGNLLLLRAATRSRELATRRALGATSRDILRQLVVEGAVLGAAGGGLGFACGEGALKVLLAIAPSQLPRIDAIGLGLGPFSATLGLSVAVILACGVLPGMRAVRLDIRRGGTSRQRIRVRNFLVASQVALALVMLSGAALLARSLGQLEHLDLGYAPEHLALIELSLPSDRLDFTHPAQARATYELLSPSIAALPGVTSISPVCLPPFLGRSVYTAIWEAEGQTADQVRANPLTPLEAGGPDYFRTLGIPLERGRGFLATDRENAPRVVVVSEATARLYWPGADPIGKRMKFAGDTVWSTVVGLTRDLHYRSLRDATPTVFMPWRQFWWTGVIAVRLRTNPASLTPAVHEILSRLDPQVSLWRIRTMDEYLAEPLAEPRLSTLLLSTFGLVALLLAAIGLYGIMASAVREETREIGVRMALGATPGQVRGAVLQRALSLCLAGAVVGIGGALAASRVIASLLFQIAPWDPIALSLASAALFAVAVVAAFVPAYHASRVDPARAIGINE